MSRELSADDVAHGAGERAKGPAAAFRIICVLVTLAVFASVAWSMAHWSESRGVYDDVCYLRQAHLFQRFGLGGIDTDLARDDDHFLSNKLREIGHPAPDDSDQAPLHRFIEATGKRVMQYPPGTGFLLAAFPAGFQVAGLYIASTAVILLIVLGAIRRARTAATLAAATLLGNAALYLMINPAKGSYSLPATLAACALAGLLTAWLFAAQRTWVRLSLTLAVGLLIGLTFNLRLANAFLAAGYLVVFGVAFLATRRWQAFAQGALFSGAFAIGVTPTLMANAINAGHPLTTTYGPQDATWPEFSWELIATQGAQYFYGTQGVLISSAIASTVAVYLLSRRRTSGNMGKVALLTAANLIVSLSYFLTHPMPSTYYAVPVSMLSLWTAFFAWFNQVRIGSEGATPVAMR